MFPIAINLIPAPSDTSLYSDGVQYLVVDNNGIYHIAVWDGEDETLVIPDMTDESIEVELESGESAPVQVDPGHVADSPVPLATEETTDVEAEEDEPLYVSFVAALPDFVAPHSL